MEHFHYAGRCAREKIILAEHNFTYIYSMERINIFERIYCLDYCLIIKMLWQYPYGKNGKAVAALLRSGC